MDQELKFRARTKELRDSFEPYRQQLALIRQFHMTGQTHLIDQLLESNTLTPIVDAKAWVDLLDKQERCQHEFAIENVVTADIGHREGHVCSKCRLVRCLIVD